MTHIQWCDLIHAACYAAHQGYPQRLDLLAEMFQALEELTHHVQHLEGALADTGETVVAITHLGIVEEATTPVYTGRLVNEFGGPIPGSTLTSLTLTHYDQVSRTILNSRDTMDVLQTNDVTVDEAALLLWVLQLADTAILDDSVTLETHVALFAWRWQGGARHGAHEIRYQVRNLVRRP